MPIYEVVVVVLCSHLFLRRQIFDFDVFADIGLPGEKLIFIVCSSARDISAKPPGPLNHCNVHVGPTAFRFFVTINWMVEQPPQRPDSRPAPSLIPPFSPRRGGEGARCGVWKSLDSFRHSFQPFRTGANTRAMNVERSSAMSSRAAPATPASAFASPFLNSICIDRAI
jgi:hypothetical protein